MNTRFAAIVATGLAVLVLTTGLPSHAGAEGPVPGAVPSDCPPLALNQVTAPYSFSFALSAGELQHDYLSTATGLAHWGYRPVRLAGYQDAGKIRHAVRMVQDGAHSFARFELTAKQFDEDWATYKQTHRMIDVSVYNTPVGVRYNAIWQKNSTGVTWGLYTGTTVTEMDALITSQKQSGFAPERVDGYRDGNQQLRFVSTWLAVKSCDWQMDAVMTFGEYDNTFDNYAAAGYRQYHVEATRLSDGMRYHAIWWRQPGPDYSVRVDRDWYLLQALDNNMLCGGFPATNFYATDNGASARFGAIWTFADPPVINDSSPLPSRVMQRVNCAPGRAGSAVINVTTGQTALAHADQTFGTSSTIKSAILYALLRRAEAEGFDLTSTTLDVGTQYGSNQGPDMGGPESGPLLANTEYTLDFLVKVMIDFSNNWATNRILDLALDPDGDLPLDGFDTVNAELAALGLSRTRLERYMTGTNAPSAHGLGGPGDDYRAGWDNVTTPREYATFLKLVHQNPGLLSASAQASFWGYLALNGPGDPDRPGFTGNTDLLATGVDPQWTDVLTSGAKSGSNHWGWNTSVQPWLPTNNVGDYVHRPQLGPHVQKSQAGRLVFANGQVAVFATFINEATNVDTDEPLDNAIACVVVDAAREFSGVTTGVALPECK